MFFLSILWLVLGLVIGALAIAARPDTSRSGLYDWRILLLIGALAGLAGGWLGTLLLGRFFGTATSAWVAVLAAVLIPWVAGRRSAA
jgi:uncharacterized membrane protein YeaQ/YmgE (transglycosylase-associated protein family)